MFSLLKLGTYPYTPTNRLSIGILMATMYGHDVKSLCDPFIEVAGEERALEMIAATVYSSKHQVVIDVLLIADSHSRVRYRKYLKNRGTSEFILCLLHFRQLRQ